MHSDVRGSAAVMDGIALRRDGRTTAWTGTTNTIGTIDVAVVMAHSDHSKLSATFSSNYASPPTLVMKRVQISLPDNQQPPTTGLPPWNILFPFDTTWVYDGKQDLAWELQMYGTLAQTYFIDYGSSTVSGNNVNYGMGCTATGQTNAMLQQFFLTEKPWSNTIEYSGRIFYGPTPAKAGIALGAQRTAQTVGWCTQVYTQPLFMWFGMTSTTNGVFSIPTVKLKWQNVFANATFFTQGFAEDFNLPGGLALSQGLQTTIPPMPTDTRAASRIYTIGGTPTTATGSVGEGGAVATRFQYK